MSDHVHNWVLVDTYDSHAIKPKIPITNVTVYSGMFGGRARFYDNQAPTDVREEIMSILNQSYEPHYTSETWACECGERKTNHHEEPSVTQRILNDTKSEEKPS